MSYREEISKIYKNEGFMGFTRGYSGMILRDSPGFGIYFTLFELFKRTFKLPELEMALENSIKSSDGNDSIIFWAKLKIGLTKFACGGTAGCLTWFACYPMDTIKAKMQTH